MNTIKLSALFTPDQMKHLIHLNLTSVGAPSRAFLAYIKAQPDVLKKCEEQIVLPEYLAYYIEFILAQYVRGSSDAL